MLREGKLVLEPCDSKQDSLELWVYDISEEMLNNKLASEAIAVCSQHLQLNSVSEDMEHNYIGINLQAPVVLYSIPGLPIAETYSLNVFHISKENSKFIISFHSSSCILDFALLFQIPGKITTNKILFDRHSCKDFLKIKLKYLQFILLLELNLISFQTKKNFLNFSTGNRIISPIDSICHMNMLLIRNAVQCMYFHRFPVLTTYFSKTKDLIYYNSKDL